MEYNCGAWYCRGSPCVSSAWLCFPFVPQPSVSSSLWQRTIHTTRRTLWRTTSQVGLSSNQMSVFHSFPEVSLDKTWFVDELFEGVASRSCLMLNISILFRQAFSSRTKWTMLPGLGGGMTLFTASRCSQWLLLCSWSGLLNFASRSAICWGRFSGDNGKKRAPHSIPCTNDGSSNSSVTSPSSLQKFDKVVLCFLNWW